MTTLKTLLDLAEDLPDDTIVLASCFGENYANISDFDHFMFHLDHDGCYIDVELDILGPQWRQQKMIDNPTTLGDFRQINYDHDLSFQHMEEDSCTSHKIKAIERIDDILVLVL